MWNRNRSVTLSVAVCFAFAVILTVGLFFGPWAIKMWFSLYRGLDPDGSDVRNLLALFKLCFYFCAPFGYITLYSLTRLLFNIKDDEIFIKKNVQHLRRISWCCFVVALITGVGGVQYIPFLFIAIAAAFVGLLLRVVKNVMQSAVIIKTENELTI